MKEWEGFKYTISHAKVFAYFTWFELSSGLSVDTLGLIDTFLTLLLTLVSSPQKITTNL